MNPFASHDPVREEELAALLSGSLTGRKRKDLLARLSADPESRTLLCMAIEALEVLDEPGSRRRQRDRSAA